MSEPKKYESLGVDKEKQSSEPTLVEKAQQKVAEAKASNHTGIASPDEVNKAFAHTTQHQSEYRTAGQDNGRLEEVETGGGRKEDELTPSTTKPSVEKAKQDAAKEDKK